jgi:hypothetical protein
MKHVQPVSKLPQVAQTPPQSNFEAKMQFKVNLTDQIIQFVFNKTN